MVELWYEIYRNLIIKKLCSNNPKIKVDINIDLDPNLSLSYLQFLVKHILVVNKLGYNQILIRYYRISDESGQWFIFWFDPNGFKWHSWWWDLIFHHTTFPNTHIFCTWLPFRQLLSYFPFTIINNPTYF